ncbi:hypothetical protein JKY79_02110 [Candidatus Babeliales bacterium]|nr:hypothetical protein [Candidatus Babeliales bacterium]
MKKIILLSLICMISLLQASLNDQNLNNSMQVSKNTESSNEDLGTEYEDKESILNRYFIQNEHFTLPALVGRTFLFYFFFLGICHKSDFIKNNKEFLAPALTIATGITHKYFSENTNKEISISQKIQNLTIEEN